MLLCLCCLPLQAVKWLHALTALCSASTLDSNVEGVSRATELGYGQADRHPTSFAPPLYSENLARNHSVVNHARAIKLDPSIGHPKRGNATAREPRVWTIGLGDAFAVGNRGSFVSNFLGLYRDSGKEKWKLL